MHIFIVNLNEVALDKMFLVLPAVDYCNDLVKASGNDASEVIDMLLPFLIRTLSLHAIDLDIVRLLLHVLLPTHDGVSLPASRLPIRKNGSIVSLKHVLNNRESGVLIDILLCGLR